MPIKGFGHYSEHNCQEVIEMYGVFTDIDYSGKKRKTIEKRLRATAKIPYIDDQDNQTTFPLSWRLLRYSLNKPHYAKNQPEFFTQEEENIIKEYYPEFGIKYCSELLNKRVDSILHKAKELKIRRRFRCPKGLNSASKQLYYRNELKQTSEGRKVITIKQFIKTAKKRAKKKDMTFDLTYKHLESIFPEYCPILGIKLELCQRDNLFNCPSLDRIDNNLGYISSNVQIISNKANMLKNDSSLQDILQIIRYMRFDPIPTEFLELSPDEKEKIFKSVLGAKERAARKGLEYDLDSDSIYNIVPVFCPVFKKQIIFSDKEMTPTIDRFDNNKGYTMENIRIISRVANTRKNYGTLEDFAKIYQYMKNTKPLEI
jgi:hypothetical protein